MGCTSASCTAGGHRGQLKGGLSSPQAQDPKGHIPRLWLLDGPHWDPTPGPLAGHLGKICEPNRSEIPSSRHKVSCVREPPQNLPSADAPAVKAWLQLCCLLSQRARQDAHASASVSLLLFATGCQLLPASSQLLQHSREPENSPCCRRPLVARDLHSLRSGDALAC